jgi:hypothetical protein
MVQLWNPAISRACLRPSKFRPIDHPNTSQEFRCSLHKVRTLCNTEINVIHCMLNDSHSVSGSQTQSFITRNVQWFDETWSSYFMFSCCTGNWWSQPVSMKNCYDSQLTGNLISEKIKFCAFVKNTAVGSHFIRVSHFIQPSHIDSSSNVTW